MAGDTHEIDLGRDGLLPPWTTLFDVVAATDPNNWVLVGGLMVQLHAYRADIPPSRTTKDVDLVVDVMATGVSIQTVAGQLKAVGFAGNEPSTPRIPACRYLRTVEQTGLKEQVDLMVPADLPQRFQPRLMRRPVVAVPSGKQALRRRDTFKVHSRAGMVTLGAPDVLGAIIAKSAAYGVDQRDRDRHLEDAALLLASIDAVGRLALDNLSKNDKRSLVRIASALPDNAAAWRELGSAQRLRGQRQLIRLIDAARLDLSGRGSAAD